MANQEIKCRRIAIIQFLRDCDEPQGEKLYEEIKELENTEQDFVISCTVAKSKEEFFKAIDNLCKELIEPTLVTLHLDTHGCEDGIGIDRFDNFITWHELYEHIRPINIKLHNTLMIVMSVCVGAGIMTCLEPNNRAPFMAFIGNTRSVLFSDAAKGFPLFYKNYRTPLDFPKALESLNSVIDFKEPLPGGMKKTEFFVYSSQEMFEQVMNPDRDKSNFKDIVLKMKFNDTSITDEEKIKIARTMIINEANRLRDFFNFQDELR